MIRDGDADFDRFREDVDLGLVCPNCYVTGYVEKRPAAAKTFRCICCNRVWSSWDDVRGRAAA